MTTDERRAQVIETMLYEQWGIIITHGDMIARAIRKSDEGEGKILLPQRATDHMEHAGGCAIEHPNVYMGGPKPGSKLRAVRVYETMTAAALEAEK